MKTFSPIFLLAVGLALLLPSSQMHSQLAPTNSAANADPLQTLQAVQKANEDLLKRQDATLKELTDATTEAREARIFSKRG